VLFFQKKRKKLLTEFPGIATLGCHNSAMITDRRKFTSKLPHYGCIAAVLMGAVTPSVALANY